MRLNKLVLVSIPVFLLFFSAAASANLDDAWCNSGSACNESWEFRLPVQAPSAGDFRVGTSPLDWPIIFQENQLGGQLDPNSFRVFLQNASGFFPIQTNFSGPLGASHVFFRAPQAGTYYIYFSNSSKPSPLPSTVFSPNWRSIENCSQDAWTIVVGQAYAFVQSLSGCNITVNGDTHVKQLYNTTLPKRYVFLLNVFTGPYGTVAFGFANETHQQNTVSFGGGTSVSLNPYFLEAPQEFSGFGVWAVKSGGPATIFLQNYRAEIIDADVIRIGGVEHAPQFELNLPEYWPFDKPVPVIVENRGVRPADNVLISASRGELSQTTLETFSGNKTILLNFSLIGSGVEEVFLRTSVGEKSFEKTHRIVFYGLNQENLSFSLSLLDNETTKQGRAIKRFSFKNTLSVPLNLSSVSLGSEEIHAGILQPGKTNTVEVTSGFPVGFDCTVRSLEQDPDKISAANGMMFARQPIDCVNSIASSVTVSANFSKATAWNTNESLIVFDVGPEENKTAFFFMNKTSNVLVGRVSAFSAALPISASSAYLNASAVFQTTGDEINLNNLSTSVDGLGFVLDVPANTTQNTTAFVLLPLNVSSVQMQSFAGKSTIVSFLPPSGIDANNVSFTHPISESWSSFSLYLCLFSNASACFANVADAWEKANFSVVGDEILREGDHFSGLVYLISFVEKSGGGGSSSGGGGSGGGSGGDSGGTAPNPTNPAGSGQNCSFEIAENQTSNNLMISILSPPSLCECFVKIDDADWEKAFRTNTTSEHAFFNIPDGSHVIFAKCSDLAGNVFQKSQAFVVNASITSLNLAWNKAENTLIALRGTRIFGAAFQFFDVLLAILAVALTVCFIAFRKKILALLPPIFAAKRHKDTRKI